MNEKFYGSVNGQRTGCSCESAPEQRNTAGSPDRVKLLRRIQEYNFMMIESALFLNNQPCCEAAQVTFCKYQKMYQEALAEYEDCYGPLTYNGVNVNRDGWKWVNSPWPWELEDC